MAMTWATAVGVDVGTGAEPLAVPRVSVGLRSSSMAKRSCSRRSIRSSTRVLRLRARSISDNGSTDGTERIGRAAAARGSVEFATPSSAENHGLAWVSSTTPSPSPAGRTSCGRATTMSTARSSSPAASPLSRWTPVSPTSHGTTDVPDRLRRTHFGKEANHFNLAQPSRPSNAFPNSSSSLRRPELLRDDGTPWSSRRSPMHGSIPWAERVLFVRS